MDDDRKKDINEEKPSARDIWHEKLKNSDGKKTGADIPIGDSKETLVFCLKRNLINLS